MALLTSEARGGWQHSYLGVQPAPPACCSPYRGEQSTENLHTYPPPSPSLNPLKTALYWFGLTRSPSVEQTVDLYAPKLNGPGGDATVYLRVRCCEPTGKGGGSGVGRSVSAPNVMVSRVYNIYVLYFVLPHIGISICMLIPVNMRTAVVWVWSQEILVCKTDGLVVRRET